VPIPDDSLSEAIHQIHQTNLSVTEGSINTAYLAVYIPSGMMACKMETMVATAFRGTEFHTTMARLYLVKVVGA
jgi:hypothetical protein